MSKKGRAPQGTSEAATPSDALGAEGESAGASADADLIARNLRKIFTEVENEPLPDRFAALLDQFRAQEKGEEEK